MSLYGLSAIVLTLAAVLSVMVFVSYRKRLAEVEAASEAGTDLTLEQIEQVFSSTMVERTVGYVLIAAIAYLIFQTIQQGFDFALLMIGATLYTGLIFLADRLITRKQREKLLKKAGRDLPNFEEQTDKAALEPGLIENSRAFFPILVFVFLLRSFLVEPFQIPSGSMKPTLEIHDFILVNRFAYGVRMPITNKVIVPVADPVQGDVIVFKPPHDPDKNFIKRVIAVPGDLVQYDYARKILRVNGEVVNKAFIEKTSDDVASYNLYNEILPEREHLIYTNQGRALRSPYEWLPVSGVVVPEGKYFVMGDNRDNSQDARYWEGIRRVVENDPNNTGNNAWGFVDENAILGKAFVVWMHWEGFYPTFGRAGSIQ
ncbi:signal peptidase I [Reinekea marinisedimentorum]|uniref:Signal peptidase I n=1 Tax=Reinekea marinisedimentorum TaxID=230495 RepID=A0A4R3I229_9GAMM|nr:signal peptidase I [Reinekea marinisedimentorum]TCS39807.1 signal peptidase I [Reinekea marinisedimentorum]